MCVELGELKNTKSVFWWLDSGSLIVFEGLFLELDLRSKRKIHKELLKTYETN